MRKSKPKAATNKAAKKESVEAQEPANPVEMRQRVIEMVGAELENIARAVVDEAKRGQLATVKYLFELSGVYPLATEHSQDRPEEGETLARMLLTRLGIPLEPAISPNDDVPEKLPTPAAKRSGNNQDTAEGQRKEASKRSELESGDANEEDEEAIVPVS
jgi:hypothetical protein